MELQQDSSGTYSDWNFFLQPFQYSAEAGVSRGCGGALYFSLASNGNGLKYAAGHLLVKVFSCSIVRPMFVNTTGEKVLESLEFGLCTEKTCYIP